MDYAGYVEDLDYAIMDALPMDVGVPRGLDLIDRDQLPPDVLADLQELEAVLLDEALNTDPEYEHLMTVLLEDHPDIPLERWWWHLGAIRRREYPAELLPEHLQADYLSALRA